jgi:ComF family protein
MIKFAKKFSKFILDLIFPIECLGCEQEGGYLCDACFKKLKFNDANFLSYALANLNAVQIDKIYIAGDYEDPILKKLIIKYKYNFMSSLGKILARFLIEFWKLQNEEIETLNFKITKPQKNFIVIPIPLSKKRLRWRGFNQAEIIAREFATDFNYELNLDLTRIKYQRPQAELSETERLENIKTSFAWKEEKINGDNLKGNLKDNLKESLKEKTIILIDDVITTGATLNEAARVLKEAGAIEVYALVLAKG